MLLAKFKFGSCKRDFISSTNFEDKINILIKRGRVDLQSKKKKKYFSYRFVWPDCGIFEARTLS